MTMDKKCDGKLDEVKGNIRTFESSLENNLPELISPQKTKASDVKKKSGLAWNSDRGSMKHYPREKIVEMVKRGAKTRIANRKANSEYAKNYSLCHKCEFQKGCDRAFEEVWKGEEKYNRLKKDPVAIKDHWNIEKWLVPRNKARCVFELESRNNDKNAMARRYKAFCSSNPEDLLAKLSDAFKHVEQLSRTDPSFAKAQKVFYMLTKLLELKNKNKKSSTNIQINSGSNTSIDIKGIMNQLREEETKAIEDNTPPATIDDAIDISNLQRPANETTPNNPKKGEGKGEGSQKRDVIP